MLANFRRDFFNASLYSYLYILHTKLLSDTECQRFLPNPIVSVPILTFVSFVMDNFLKFHKIQLVSCLIFAHTLISVCVCMTCVYKNAMMKTINFYVTLNQANILDQAHINLNFQ